MIVETKFGAALRAARVAKHLSLTVLAEKIGVSAATLSRIETDKQNLDVSTFVELTRTLGVEPAHILGSHRDERSDDAIVGDLVALSPANRVRIFAEAAKRERRGKSGAGVLNERLEAALASLDMLREELLDVRAAMRRR
jgi:transcriptional regulator with XRE-family HTH domain